MEENSSITGIQNAESFFIESVYPLETEQFKGPIEIVLSEPKVQSSLESVLHEQKQYLLDLVGIAVSYMEKQASTNPLAMYDVELWEKVLSHLPLMNVGRFSSEQSSHNVDSVDDAFTYLKRGSQMGAITIIIETISLGSRIQLSSPKIKTYFLRTSQEELEKLVEICVAGGRGTIIFSSQESISLFNYDSLRREDVKKRFTKFLQDTPKIDVTAWKNFFNVIRRKSNTSLETKFSAEKGFKTAEQLHNEKTRIAELEQLVGQLRVRLERHGQGI